MRGQGRYLDDIRFEGQAYAAFVRSPHAHAQINSIDSAAALALDGVLAVLSGEEMAADGIGPLPCGWMIHSTDGAEMNAPPHPALAVDTVRYVGEPLAVVIAESAEQAKTGAEKVSVDWEVLDHVTGAGKATAEGSPQIHEAAPSNRCYLWELGDGAAVDAAFKAAAHITELSLVNNRLAPNPIEPRAANARYNPTDGKYTLHTTSQNPHLHRLILAAFVGIAPEGKIRVISPDVGGGFGSKIFVYSEETTCLWAAKRVGRPVKWTGDRSEAFLSDAHGRDHVTSAELALDGDGNFLGLRVRTVANLGAYLSTFASAVPTILYGTLLAGQYKTPAVHVEVEGVFTNTSPVDAYRGAGRPEAAYLLERIVDKAARELGRDPAELRRQNMIPADAFPYQTPVALEYDTGDFQASLDRALELADYTGFDERRAEAAARGRLRGIGLSSYIEACGLAPSQLAGQLGAGVGLFESALVRVDATGSVTVFTGSHSHGQGHETTFAQLVAGRLGLSMAEVDVVHGDTQKVQYGLGTYGSRSLAVGGSAIAVALDKIVEKGRRIAAHMLEVDPEVVDFEEGLYSVRETNQSLSFKEVAFSAYVPFNYPLDEMEPGLQEGCFYDPKNFTYPAGTHVCEVEIDPETGVTEIIRFTAVDDFGRIINPMIVEGQVHGGIAQGIGQARMEAAIYDETSGQLVTGSFLDYALPRADDFPDFELELTETPCTHNPLGVKGCGEAGAIGSPPAYMNAVLNAIGADHMDMPATPERVWRALQDVEAVGGAE